MRSHLILAARNVMLISLFVVRIATKLCNIHCPIYLSRFVHITLSRLSFLALFLFFNFPLKSFMAKIPLYFEHLHTQLSNNKISNNRSQRQRAQQTVCPYARLLQLSSTFCLGLSALFDNRSTTIQMIILIYYNRNDGYIFIIAIINIIIVYYKFCSYNRHQKFYSIAL